MDNCGKNVMTTVVESMVYKNTVVMSCLLARMEHLDVEDHAKCGCRCESL